jgi:hypothetical protein
MGQRYINDNKYGVDGTVKRMYIRRGEIKCLEDKKKCHKY